MSVILSKLPRSRLITAFGGRASQFAARSMSAHVWYRASSEFTEDGSLITMDAPETALGTVTYANITNKSSTTTEAISIANKWSGMMSFASPESDFASWNTTNPQEDSSMVVQTVNDQDIVMMDAPETAFGSIALSEVFGDAKTEESLDTNFIHEMISLHESMLTVDHPETALGVIALSELVDEATLDKLRKKPARAKPLPKTMNEYLATQHDDDRAMVVTHAKKPFTIVNVNDAWVGLCGYTPEESFEKSLGTLLQGPDTNPRDLDQFMLQLQQGNEATAIITNYTKSGRPFRNRIRAGPIQNDDNVITHFVGVLEDITESSSKKANA